MMFTKETWRRALRTFIQVVLGYIATNIFVVDFNAPSDVWKSALVGVIVSALAAGLAAVMNLEKKPTDPEPEEVVE